MSSQWYPILLMGLAGILAGGALSLRQQGAPMWSIILMWALVAVSLMGAYVAIGT